MKKIYHLSTCNTCQKILNSADFSSFEKIDIKTNPLGVDELEKLKELAGSYEALFSKRAKLYREMGLHEMSLTEKDFKHYLLEHYTFLKRPVIVFENEIWIGSSPKTKKEIIEKFG